MSDIHQDVAEYYSAKVVEHGTSPQGVDWNSEEGQILRFQQLTKLFVDPDHISVNDFGCGYGAMFEYLSKDIDNLTYSGCDISEPMIRAAEQRLSGELNASFVFGSRPPKQMDYTVASGVFNVRQDRSDDEWLCYILETLKVLDDSSRIGFAFNCLTSYSDEDKKRKDLFYADPCFLFDHCKRQYSRHVSLLHDYGLYEFTLLIRKLV